MLAAVYDEAISKTNTFKPVIPDVTQNVRACPRRRSKTANQMIAVDHRWASRKYVFIWFRQIVMYCAHGQPVTVVFTA